MWKSTFFVTALFFALSLTACKPEGEKKIERAKDLIAAQNEAAQAVTDAGIPNSSWEPAQLDSFQNKIDRLADLEAQLKAMNGCSNGACVSTWGYNDDLIARRRSQLAVARAAKQGQPTQGLPKTDDEKIAELNEMATDVNKRYTEIVNSYPDASKSLEELRELLTKIETFNTKASALSAGLNNAPSTAVGIYTMRSQIENLTKRVEARRSQVNNLIGEKIKQNESDLPSAPTNVLPSQGSQSTTVDADEAAITALGAPDVNWTVDQLTGYASKNESLMAKYVNQLSDSSLSSTQRQVIQLKADRCQTRINMANAKRVMKMLKGTQDMLKGFEQNRGQAL